MSLASLGPAVPELAIKCILTKSSNFSINFRVSIDKHLKNRKISFLKNLGIFLFFQKILKPLLFDKSINFLFLRCSKYSPCSRYTIREILDKVLQRPCPCLNILTSSTERLNRYFVIFSAVLGYKFGGFYFWRYGSYRQIRQ